MSSENQSRLIFQDTNRANRPVEVLAIREIEKRLTRDEQGKFWWDVERLFYVWDSHARGDKGIHPREKFTIACDVMFGTGSVADYAKSRGYSDQFTRSARHLLLASTLIAGQRSEKSHLDYFCLPLSPEQKNVFDKLQEYDNERQVLEQKINQPHIKAKLKELPHLNWILGSYTTFGTLQPLLGSIELNWTEAEIGDQNKEIKAFILGKRNQGIGRLSQRVLFQRWLTSGLGMHANVDYQQNIAHGIHQLILLQPASLTLESHRKLRSAVEHFFDLILEDEQKYFIYPNDDLDSMAKKYTLQEFAVIVSEYCVVPKLLRETLAQFVAGLNFSEITRNLVRPDRYLPSQNTWTAAGLWVIEEILCMNKSALDTKSINKFFNNPAQNKIANLFEALKDD